MVAQRNWLDLQVKDLEQGNAAMPSPYSIGFCWFHGLTGAGALRTLFFYLMKLSSSHLPPEDGTQLKMLLAVSICVLQNAFHCASVAFFVRCWVPWDAPFLFIIFVWIGNV